MSDSANLIRTVGDIKEALLNADAKTLTVTGLPAQVGIAAWLFAQVDRPKPSNPATQEYRPEGSVNDVVQLVYLTHLRTLQGLQEAVNAVLTLPNFSKALPLIDQNAVVTRGTDDQSTMAKWLVTQVDLPTRVQPTAPAGQSPAVHQYVVPGAADDVARVFCFTHATKDQTTVEVTNLLRVIPGLSRLSMILSSGTIAVRGSSAKVALAAWLFDKVDRDAPNSSQNSQTIASPQPFPAPGNSDDVVQMFYLSSICPMKSS